MITNGCVDCYQVGLWTSQDEEFHGSDIKRETSKSHDCKYDHTIYLKDI